MMKNATNPGKIKEFIILSDEGKKTETVVLSRRGNGTDQFGSDKERSTFGKQKIPRDFKFLHLNATVNHERENLPPQVAQVAGAVIRKGSDIDPCKVLKYD
jgi:hypothetical protein